jgi:hypothetical protein
VSKYDYDESQQVSLDDHDRSQNAPKSLVGDYPLDLRPQADWPGMSASPSDIRLDTAAVNRIADWLNEQAGLLAGVPDQLKAGTEGVRFGPDSWVEANHLSTASSQVSLAVRQFGQEMIENLNQAAEAIRMAARKFEESDEQNQGTSDSLSSRVPDGITSSGSGSGRHRADPPKVF